MIKNDLSTGVVTVYSIEMAYARMRELQDQANRSRAAQLPATPRARRRLGRAAAKKR
ncbi:hypothetical protein ACO0M4_20640 [Streptomyces sp. RGM 3693]|uniref:hypothetical protein n=1 Tax=Streptomyces sp. RGM 3693 TaxID=3413284 RepID=UPI003D2678A8